MVALNFEAQFADDVEDGRKRRTIRAPRKDGRNPKAGDKAHLYTGMRQKGCRKLGEATVTRVRGVEISHMGVRIARPGSYTQATLLRSRARQIQSTTMGISPERMASIVFPIWRTSSKRNMACPSSDF